MGVENNKDPGTMTEQGIWRMRTNEELGELYKDLDVVTDIKKKRLEWIGHAIRMEQVTTVKKILENKPEGSGRKGRPRMM
jgi:hypothetical protein